MYGETFHRIYSEAREYELAAKANEIEHRRLWAEFAALDKLERAISAVRGRVAGTTTTLSQAR